MLTAYEPTYNVNFYDVRAFKIKKVTLGIITKIGSMKGTRRYNYLVMRSMVSRLKKTGVLKLTIFNIRLYSTIYKYLPKYIKEVNSNFLFNQ